MDLLDDITLANDDLESDDDVILRWSERGTAYSRGEIWIDRNASLGEVGTRVAHELTHLHRALSGVSPSRQAMGEDEYVTARLEEEADAHAAAYVIHWQSGRDGGEPACFSAFKSWVASQNYESWGDIERLAKHYTRYLFDNGTLRSSRTGLDYATNYRNQHRAYWRRAALVAPQGQAAAPGQPSNGRRGPSH